METLWSEYGDVSVHADARITRLTTTTGSGTTLRFCATGNVFPDDHFFNVMLRGGGMPGYRGSFLYDLAHFRSPGDDVLQDIDWMLAVSGAPLECAVAVQYFCTLTAGITAAGHWTGAFVVVVMPEPRSHVRVEIVKYGEGAAGVLREVACGICFEEFVEGIEVGRMQCSHAYHEKCPRQWLDEKHSCPYCRAPVQA